MGIKEAIKNRDKNELTKVVEAAVKIYNAELPAEPSIETVYGEVPIQLLMDDDSKWQLATQEFVRIANEAKSFSDGIQVSQDMKDNLNKKELFKLTSAIEDKIEIMIAKLIATSSIFRHLTTVPTLSTGLL